MFHHTLFPRNTNTNCILLTLFAWCAIRVKRGGDCVKAFDESTPTLLNNHKIKIS